jgi:chitin synthase
MGLLAIIALLMAGVGFLTFGFQNAVCKKPPNQFRVGQVDTNSVIINGRAYNLAEFKHPAAAPTFDGNMNPLKTAGFDVIAKDISFMFQKVNGTCQNLIATQAGSVIANNGGNPHWYFPCNPYPQTGATGKNVTGYDSGFQCHAQPKSRQLLDQISPSGLVSYAWGEVTADGPRNLAVFES